MKVLFLHHNQPDYLAETLFHGLRTLLGENCVDVPRYDSIYTPLTHKLRSKLRGYGFTLYGLLEDIPELAESRYFWKKDLEYYDFIVVANIEYQWQLFWNLSSLVNPEKLAILDGADAARLFPYTSFRELLKRPLSLLAPISQVKYFKRELIGEGYSYGLDQFLPRQLHQWIPKPQNTIPISFSIPQEKICKEDRRARSKDFPIHIVDSEVSLYIPGTSGQYAFLCEAEYYDDLRQSRFGVTTKRGGWDCLRHYEFAANGCVLCFRDLDLKPETCAPHGLNEYNCIIYHSFEELKDKISTLTDDDYYQLQSMTYQWASDNTTVERAKYFLQCCS